MTTLQSMESTPMAPYVGLLDSMTREQKMIVVKYITESMEKPDHNVAEQVRKKYGAFTVTGTCCHRKGMAYGA